MTKTILITGATDGIGLETARRLASDGHTVLLHGRSARKLGAVAQELGHHSEAIETHRADLSSLAEVVGLAEAVADRHQTVDVIINNAGVFATPAPITAAGYDVRFVVNVMAPYLLTTRLLPVLPKDGRIVNLSSAAQAPVSLAALAGQARLDDGEAYAQSKLALTMWSFHLARQLATAGGPAVIAVNPGSLLASKMVRDAYGVAGKDLGIGADVLCRAAVGDEFAGASGQYFDNDRGQFSRPHPDALDPQKNAQLVAAIDSEITRLTASQG